MYELPKFNKLKLRSYRAKKPLRKTFHILILVVLISSFFGFFAGVVSSSYFYLEIKQYLSELNIEAPEPQIVENERIIERITEKEYIPQTTQEEKIIRAVKEVSPSVVSIVITKDVPIIEQYFIDPFGGASPFKFQIPEYRQKGVEKQEIGGGSGFIVSEDGMILTNKHVVLDEDADYTVFTNEGEKFSAKVLDKDPFQDIALLKIETKKTVDENGKVKTVDFPFVVLGDSSSLQIGQSVIAIGNALGEFSNTVSVGVISGLGRTITASGGGLTETLEDVIQTDAAINKGNSGGPLLNLKGEVIGVNTAMVQGGAENIGFAIPINYAKKDIENVKEFGKIKRAFLGIHYVLIREGVQKENDLPVDYGVWVISGKQGEPAVVVGSAAKKAGLKEQDIILEFDEQKITYDNSLRKIILNYSPDDKVKLKILRPSVLASQDAPASGYKQKILLVTLGEYDEK